MEAAEQAVDLEDEERRELYRLSGQARFEAREVMPGRKSRVFERLSERARAFAERFEGEPTLPTPLRSLATHLTEVGDLLESEG